MIRSLLLSALASSLFASSALSAPPNIVIGHAIEQESPLGKAIDRVAAELNKSGFKAQAKHRIVEWPGVNTKGELAIMQALRKNEVQIMFLSDGPCANIAPKCTLFTMPFVFESPEHAYKVADHEEVLKDIGSDFEKQELRLLAIYENGWRQFFSPKEVIRSPEQIKGQKFRVMQSPAYMKFATALGGIPTPTAWPDVYEQTKAGFVYGFEVPIPPFYSAKLHEVNKNITITNHMYSVFYAVINNKTWNSLSNDQKTKLSSVLWNERVRQRQENAEDDKAKLAELKKQKGVVVHNLTSEEIQKFRTATRPVFEEFSPRFSKAVHEVIAKSK